MMSSFFAPVPVMTEFIKYLALGFSVLAAYCAAGFATAGIHSWLMLRRGRNRFDEVAIAIALTVGGIAVLAQGISGELSRVGPEATGSPVVTRGTRNVIEC
jgi:cytochrome bd-type quinol oxidase subunit 1